MTYDPYTGERLRKGKWESDYDRQRREEAEDAEADAHMNDEPHGAATVDAD